MTQGGSFARFVATGLLNTLFGYGLYAALVVSGLGYLPALLLATMVGLTFNFFSFGRLAFRIPLAGRRFPGFVMVYAASLTLNAVLLRVAVQVVGLGPYLGQLVCVPLVALLTYLALERWVYVKEKHAER